MHTGLKNLMVVSIHSLVTNGILHALSKLTKCIRIRVLEQTREVRVLETCLHVIDDFLR